MKMKKKMIVTGVAAVAFVAALQTSSIFAAAPAEETPSSFVTAAPAKKTTSNFVTTEPIKEKSSDDINTNTVCNYCGKDCSFVDEDGDGICDNYKQRGINGANAGKGFVDEDGDGVCDNYASRGQNGACGWGGGHGHRNHGHSGHGGGCHRR